MYYIHVNTVALYLYYYSWYMIFQPVHSEPKTTRKATSATCPDILYEFIKTNDMFEVKVYVYHFPRVPTSFSLIMGR